MTAATFDAEIRAIRRARRDYEIAERAIASMEWNNHWARVYPAQHAAMKAAGGAMVGWIADPVGQIRHERWKVGGQLFLVTYTMDALTCVPTEPSGMDLVDVREQLGGNIYD